MKLLLDDNILVILGNWNKYIFSKEWTSKYLFPKDKLEIEYPINFDGSLRFSTDKIRLFTIENKLNFSILNNSDETINIIQDCAFKIADYLPHTPVQAFGINFRFESELTSQLKNLFELSDNEKYIENDINFENISVIRSVNQKNHILNLNLTKKQDKCIINFNFHHNINSMIEFKKEFDSDILISYKKNSLDLLNNLYDLNLD